MNDDAQYCTSKLISSTVRCTSGLEDHGTVFRILSRARRRHSKSEHKSVARFIPFRNLGDDSTHHRIMKNSSDDCTRGLSASPASASLRKNRNNQFQTAMRLVDERALAEHQTSYHVTDRQDQASLRPRRFDLGLKLSIGPLTCRLVGYVTDVVWVRVERVPRFSIRTHHESEPEPISVEW